MRARWSPYSMIQIIGTDGVPPLLPTWMSLGACRTWKNKRIKYLYYIDYQLKA